MYSSAQLLTFCFSVTSSIWKAADVARHVFIHKDFLNPYQWSSFRMFKWMYSHSLQKAASSKEFIIGLYFMTPCLTVADSPTCVLCVYADLLFTTVLSSQRLFSSMSQGSLCQSKDSCHVLIHQHICQALYVDDSGHRRGMDWTSLF